MLFSGRDDRAYYRARAETEIEAAHEAGHPVAARAHYTLAAHYLDLAHNPEAPRLVPASLGATLAKRTGPAAAPGLPAGQSRSG
jgi:hypothetical protein